MPAMNSTSASLYGRDPSTGGVGCSPDAVRPHPPPSAAVTTNAATAGRSLLLIRSSTRILFDPARRYQPMAHGFLLNRGQGVRAAVRDPRQPNGNAAAT